MNLLWIEIISCLSLLYLYRDPLRDGGNIRTPIINSNPEYQLASRVATSQLKEPRVRPVDTRDLSWYEGFGFPSVPIKGSRYRHYYFCSIWGPSIRDIHSNYRFVSHIVWNKEYEVHKLSTLSPASYDIICGWSPKHKRCDFFSLVVWRRRGATDSSLSSGASGRGSTPACSSF